MAAETTAIYCATHNHKVKAGIREGVIMHLGGNLDPYCSAQRFEERTARKMTREEALAELAGENESAPMASAREDREHGTDR